MFVINDDQSIYATRGDIVFFTVSADDGGESYAFQPGDVVRMKVYGKKDAETVLMQKDFPVTAATQEVEIYLTEADTKMGEVISKPKDYWYEIELNPYNDPQTIIGYDEDGAKVFKLFPEGDDVEEDAPEITPEDIPLVDDALDMTSLRPVANQAIARAVAKLETAVKDNKEASAAKDNQLHARMNDIAETVIAEQARVDLVLSGETADGAEVVDIRVGADGVTYESAGTAVRSQVLISRMRAKDISNKSDSEEVVECALASGYVGSDGTLNAAGATTREVTTDYIPVKAYDFFKVYTPTVNTSAQWRAVSYYDAEKKFIKRGDHSTDTQYVLPTADGYIRVSFRSYGVPYVFITKRNVLARDDQIIAGFHKANYDYKKLTFSAGFADTTGAVVVPSSHQTREVCTQRLFVNPGEKYFVASQIRNTYGTDAAGVCHWLAVNAYDADGNPVSRLASQTITEEADDQIYTATAEITIPSGVNYIVISTRTYDDCVVNLAQVIEPVVVEDAQNAYSVVHGVAHRGLSAVAPENTLPAYRAAKQNGFRYVECDVSFTSDNVAVLLHDDTVDRTSSGSGYVSAMTLAELKELDFGGWFSSVYRGTTIPTFAEFLALCRNIGLHPYIELKAGTKSQIGGLVDLVRAYNMLDKVTWISFSYIYLGYIKEAAPKARLGYVCTTITEELIGIAENLASGENEVFMNSNSPTADGVKLCMDAGIPLEVWTLNDGNAIENVDPYVSGVTSDILCADKVLLNCGMNA